MASSAAGTPGSPITFVAEGAAARITADNPSTPDGMALPTTRRRAAAVT